MSRGQQDGWKQHQEWCSGLGLSKRTTYQSFNRWLEDFFEADGVLKVAVWLLVIGIVLSIISRYLP